MVLVQQFSDLGGKLESINKCNCRSDDDCKGHTHIRHIYNVIFSYDTGTNTMSGHESQA